MNKLLASFLTKQTCPGEMINPSEKCKNGLLMETKTKVKNSIVVCNIYIIKNLWRVKFGKPNVWQLKYMVRRAKIGEHEICFLQNSI